jgi:hypothetical protein
MSLELNSRRSSKLPTEVVGCACDTQLDLPCYCHESAPAYTPRPGTQFSTQAKHGLLPRLARSIRKIVKHNSGESMTIR